QHERAAGARRRLDCVSPPEPTPGARNERRGPAAAGGQASKAAPKSAPEASGKQSMSFADLWRDLEPLGRDPGTGGYRRYSWTKADTQCRAWFTRQAEKLGLTVEPDNNGNLWAWWGAKRENAIVTGSHLDSVPDGGGYDGALGVASALAAVEMLQDQNFYPE